MTINKNAENYYRGENANQYEEQRKQTKIWNKENEIIMLSPAFASFGMFKNEYDRGNQFIDIVNSI